VSEDVVSQLSLRLLLGRTVVSLDRVASLLQFSDDLRVLVDEVQVGDFVVKRFASLFSSVDQRVADLFNLIDDDNFSAQAHRVVLTPFTSSHLVFEEVIDLVIIQVDPERVVTSDNSSQVVRNLFNLNLPLLVVEGRDEGQTREDCESASQSSDLSLLINLVRVSHLALILDIDRTASLDFAVGMRSLLLTKWHDRVQVVEDAVSGANALAHSLLERVAFLAQVATVVACVKLEIRAANLLVISIRIVSVDTVVSHVANDAGAALEEHVVGGAFESSAFGLCLAHVADRVLSNEAHLGVSKRVKLAIPKHERHIRERQEQEKLEEHLDEAEVGNETVSKSVENRLIFV